MIYYFSGTGNSRWIAQQLARLTGDTAVDLISVSKAFDVSDSVFGIVFPIYAWGVPEPVREFLKRLVGSPSFSFAVCTCGEEAGLAMEHLTASFPLDSTYSVVMPSNYIMRADVESEAVIQKKINQATISLETMAADIQSRHSTHLVTKGSFPHLKSGMVSFLFERFARRTQPFHVTDQCISCGLCARNCPTQTIQLIDGKPHWGERCYQCTACINRCPVEAIQYGKSTTSRGRYYFEKYVNHARPINK